LHDEPRHRSDAATIHLGTDLFVPAGTPVRAPLAATVAEVDGDTAVLAHTTAHGDVWTVLRGLAPDVGAGSDPTAGDPLGRTTGGPLHVQLSLEPLGVGLPAFVPVERRAAWSAICPDPGPLVGVPSVSAGRRRSAGGGGSSARASRSPTAIRSRWCAARART